MISGTKNACDLIKIFFKTTRKNNIILQFMYLHPKGIFTYVLHICMHKYAISNKMLLRLHFKTAEANIYRTWRCIGVRFSTSLLHSYICAYELPDIKKQKEHKKVLNFYAKFLFKKVSNYKKKIFWDHSLLFSVNNVVKLKI